MCFLVLLLNCSGQKFQNGEQIENSGEEDRHKMSLSVMQICRS